MASFYDDDNSRASSDNDGDEDMEDLDGGDADVTVEMDADANYEYENQDNYDEEEQDDTQDLDDSPSRAHQRSAANGSRLLNGLKQDRLRERSSRTPPPHRKSADDGDATASGSRRGSANEDPFAPYRPILRPESITAASYDIVPTIAAPHSTSINAVTATPDMRWVFTGGSDGWVRKFNWVDTVNGKTLLTVAQRQPFVDSVVKCGVLMGYWENEETQDKSSGMQYGDEGPAQSPVYSLAVQHQALWLLSGTEAGAINLQTVRHDEGKRITSLYKHTSAVSVMSLSQDETSLLTGSWDKTINDWDLNVGQVKRSFTGSSGQISAVEIRPISNIPVPRDISENRPVSTTFTSDSTDRKKPRGSMSNGNFDASARRPSEGNMGSPSDSLFGDSLFGDNDLGAATGLSFDQEDDDLSKALADDLQQHEDRTTIGLEAPQQTEEEPNLAAEADGSKIESSLGNEAESSNSTLANGLPHAEEVKDEDRENEKPAASDESVPVSETTFLDAAIDGPLRIWDRRQPNPIARMVPPRNTPPWCMHACWSYDGNYIYAGRRNGTVDEYSIHKGLKDPVRTLSFPAGSGPVSAVRSLPNARHLVCASFDILRLYDLKDEINTKRSTVPFLIVPGHRTGVVSQLYMDATCTYMISTGGNRGWEGSSTEVLLGYEMGMVK